jgi:phosphoadenosine phosphosulfate reductase
MALKQGGQQQMSNGAFLTPEAVKSQAQSLADATCEEVLSWAIRTFPGRAGLTCSFSGQGIVLAHMIAGIDRRVPVMFLDTGFHFPETYAFKDQFVKQYNLNLVEYHPATDPGPLYETDPDGCCAIRKVEPMQRATAGLDAWITALRRDQSETRSDVDLLEYHEVDGRPLVKVLPLAHWTRTSGTTYSGTVFRTTRCWTRDTAASAVGPAPSAPSPAAMSAPVGGAGRARQSAASIRLRSESRCFPCT